MISRRHPDPAKAFLRSALLFCGVALTWTCAAFGLLVSQFAFGSHGCPSGVKIASLRVREVDNAIAQYQIDARRCPRELDDLAAGKFVNAHGLSTRGSGPSSSNAPTSDTPRRFRRAGQHLRDGRRHQERALTCGRPPAAETPPRRRRRRRGRAGGPSRRRRRRAARRGAPAARAPRRRSRANSAKSRAALLPRI